MIVAAGVRHGRGDGAPQAAAQPAVRCGTVPTWQAGRDRGRQPLSSDGQIAAYTAGRGWVLPWYSSYGSDFNYDFQVTLDKSVPLEYDYAGLGNGSMDIRRPEPDLLDGVQSTELPGASCFLREGGEIFRTYSAYTPGAWITSTSPTPTWI